MEKWNAYTKDEKMTDVILIKGEAMPEGLYHLCCDVLVKHKDGDYLIMRRSFEKRDCPGCYENTAGGAAQLNEDKYACIKRELKEETGIDCDEFEEVNRIVYENGQAIFYSFVCEVDCDKTAITLQEGETIEYKWLNEEQFKKHIKSKDVVDQQIERFKNYFIKNNLF